MTDKTDEPDPLFVEVARRFAKARKRAKLTQKDLADAIGTDQGNISRFENGLVGFATPTLLRLLRFAAEHGISVDHCLVGDGHPLRSEALVAASPELLRKLEELVNGHGAVRRSNGGDATDKRKRPGKRAHNT